MTPTYYTAELGGERRGPFTAEQVADMVRSGRITANTVFWRPGMPEWQRIAAFPMPTQEYNIVNATKAGLRRAVRFSGRSSRAEFWFFALAVFIFFIALLIINSCIANSAYFAIQENVYWVSFVFMAYCAVALLAAAARRLHDAGLTKLLLLFLLVPLFGPLGLVPFLLFPPEDTANPHGARPLAPWE
ncbi:MAG: DUF805 domain-containing protein [Akkermansia sp.]|nr:DUF805 domain-containing protein [Akkermansia sp.]